MAGETWRETSLGQLVEFQSGGTPSKGNPAFWNGSIPRVSARDMKQLFLDDTEDHITTAAAENGAKQVPAGTVLMLTRGMTLLNDVPICIVRRPMSFNQDVKALRPKGDIDGRFLPYLLLGTKHRLLSMVDLAGHGTGRLNTEELKTLDVMLPEPTEQRAIACILGALDDKIELNRRRNRTLEAMARAIFQSWFVDFDAVKAKAAEFIVDDVLEIGDGYRAKNSELAEQGLPFVRAGDLQTGFDLDGADRLSMTSVAKAGSKVSRPGDVAFTSKGTVGRLARVDDTTPQFVYSPQVCFWRSLQPKQMHPAVLYCWMCSEAFLRQVRAFSGQTDMAPYISLRDQRQILIPRFPDSQANVGDRIETLLKRQSVATAESLTLGALRDALLPKLISGELRVPDAERIVERAM